MLGALLLVSATAVFGQTAACERVYDYAEVMLSYRQDNPGSLLVYVASELGPILHRAEQRTGSEIASLYLNLLIDQQGRVRDVTIVRPRLSNQCTREVHAKLLTMTGWAPARLKGQPVCCRVAVPINCLNGR